jgi:hypothetical protein
MCVGVACESPVEWSFQGSGGEEVGELGEAPLVPPDEVELGEVDGGGQGFAGLNADVAGAPGLPLGGAEVAVPEELAGMDEGHMPPDRDEAELASDLGDGLEGLFSVAVVTGFHCGHRLVIPGAPLRSEVELLGERQVLAGVRQAFGQRVRGANATGARCEDPVQGVAVTRSPCQIQGMVAQPPSLPVVGGGVQLRRLGGEQSGAIAWPGRHLGGPAKHGQAFEVNTPAGALDLSDSRECGPHEQLCVAEMIGEAGRGHPG